MNENQNLPDAGDDFDDLDNLFAQFDGMAVEGGGDAANEEEDLRQPESQFIQQKTVW